MVELLVAAGDQVDSGMVLAVLAEVEVEVEVDDEGDGS